MKIQILDATYSYDADGFPIVTLFGLTEDGKPETKHVTGFLPYMYVDADLNQVMGFLSGIGKSIGIPVEFQKVKRFRPIGYQSSPKEMLKVITKNPKDLKILHDFCGQQEFTTYESDILFKDRFMIDHDLTGMGWAIVPRQAYIDHADIISVEDPKNAPLSIMTIDIESIPKEGGGLPTADVDPIILLSLSFSPAWRGQENIVMVAKDIGCPRDDVICSDGERDMLKKLSFIIEEYDPAIIGGYNSNEFDLPFITDRAKILGAHLTMSRDGRPPWCKSFMGKSSVSVNGRIILDLLPIIRGMDKYRLKSYSLRNVAKEILGEEKLDVKPGEMKELWEGPDIARFIKYSRRDSYLVMRLIKKLKILDKYIALAKASGAFLQVTANGGQSNMIEAKVTREYRAANRAMGEKNALEEDDIPTVVTGALVLPPDLGLTEDVDILDYKSLYPTTMMAYNLCFTTEVRDECPDCELIVSPSGGKFVPPSVLKGIIPSILEKLLDARIKAKTAMKTAKTEEEKDALDAKQYAMKILLNSFYGYSGYTRARLYSPIIANSVTSYGREDLLRTCKIIEEHKNFELDGKSYNLRVIAGDTDSVFVAISGSEINFEIAQKIGQEIASIITAGLPRPMELVFEAYAKRILIIAKKHYAMYRFESADKGVIKAKGIETVRRDWCNLTSTTLTKCLEMILIEGDSDKALEHARKALYDLRSPNLGSLDDLILTRTLARNPENYKQMQPHAELVKKLEARGIHKYVLGDRIPFVIVKGQRRTGKRKELMTSRAEDPEYVVENNIQIDTDYYITKQLLPPLARIFGSFGIGELDLLQKSTQRSLSSW